MKYLIDTGWIIHSLRGEDRIIRKLLSLKDEGLAISVVSLAELYEGVYRSKEPALSEKILKDFLTGVSVLGIDEEICRIFGQQKENLRRKGKTIGDFDLLIASTCLHHDLTLLTANIKHFEMVEILTIEC